jgi:outer membrane protein assembly factor BamB
MATLEVHDGAGHVELVTIRREHLALFGSDPKCDIVLADPKSLPFHGRIRYSKGLFKVEAFPESKSIVLNGQKVISSKFMVGDEVRVGAYRIFLINTDDKPAETEKTRVQAAPVSKAAGAGPLPRQRGPAGAAVAAPAANSPEQRLKRATPAPTAKTPSAPIPQWKRLLRKVWREQAPGEERLAGSPLVLALIVVLALLGLVGIGLWGVISSTTADRQYRQAEESYGDGDYRNAIALYDLFLKSNRKDRRAPKARTMRALANVRQYSVGAGPVWKSALEAADEMHKSLNRTPEYKDANTELAEIVLRGSEALIERARASSDPKQLAEARSALSLHTRIAAEAAKILQDKSNISKKLADAEAAVQKGQTRIKALAAMDAALKASSAANVYGSRDKLVEEYPDLARDRMVIDRLRAANDLLRLAVSLDEKGRAAETTPVSDPLGPATTYVLRNPPSVAVKSAPGTQPPVVFAISDGVAYGIEGLDGTPIWQVPVGLASPFPPLPVSGIEPGVLVFDAVRNELARLKSRTGELRWRLAIGEHVTSPPLILGNEAFLAVPSGRLLKIDLNNGALINSLKLERPLSKPPAADEAGQFLYLPADSAVMFVIARDPMSCVAVEYLGHDGGAIGCAPARLGRYLIVCENHGINDGRWHVFLIDEEGGKVRAVQTIEVAGWAWETPATAGAVVWSVNDRVGVTAYTLGEVGSKVAVQPIAKTIPDIGPAGPAFARPRSERELIVSAGRTGRFDLNIERQSLTPGWHIPAAGPALAPIQAADRLMVLTQQSTDGPGVALWSVNTTDGSVVWRTILGTPWPVALTQSADGGALTTLGTDGQTITLSRDALTRGGFVEQPIPPAVDRKLPPGPLQRIDLGDMTIIVPSSSADQILVREGTTAFQRINLPSALGAAPLLWGSDLFAPGGDGRAYLIDPKTGGSKAEPYVPPFDRAKPTQWLAPVKLEDEAVVLADTSGRIRRLVKQTDPRVHLALSGEADIGAGLASDPAASGQAVVLATEDGRIRSLAGHDLGPLGAWPLESPRAMGPVSTSGHAFVADSGGRVIAFGAEGRRLWSIDMKDSPPIGPPAVRDSAALFLGKDGVLHRRSMADGSAIDQLALGVLPAGGPWAVGPELAVGSGPGSVRLIVNKPDK